MAYGREKGFKVGGSKNRGPGFSLKSDMKLDKTKAAGKAKGAARKKV